MEEYWVEAIGFENIYEVSNFGRVRTKENKKTYTKRHGIRNWKQRILKPKVHSSGFRVDLWKDGKVNYRLVARIVAFSFLGGDISNPRMTVNHKDGNRLNNNIENLEIITLKENILHGFNNGLYPACISTTIINKIDGSEKTFRSMSQASKFIGRNVGFISNLIKKKRIEQFNKNSNYIIKIHDKEV